MRAAVVHAFDTPLQVDEVPKPEAGPGQVLVRIETCGICHTDIHAAHGDWPIKPNPPFIPGHEGVGIVEQLGSGVSHVGEGDRVAIPWLGYACGACEYCASGRETLCLNQQRPGTPSTARYAEYAVAEAAFVGHVPKASIPWMPPRSPVPASPPTRRLRCPVPRSSDLVAVFGIGGLGHLAIQYARIAGASVAAVDLVDSKLSWPAELGAEHTFNGRRRGPGRRHPGARRCRPGNRAGRLADRRRAGLPEPQARRDSGPCWSARRQLRPTAHLRNRAPGHHGHRLDRRHAGRPGRDLPAPRREGAPESCVRPRHLDEVNDAFEQIEKGEVDARLVFDFR